jgi:hypothetical protein
VPSRKTLAYQRSGCLNSAVQVTLFVVLWLSVSGRALAQAGCTARRSADSAPVAARHLAKLLGTWDIMLIDTTARPQPAVYRDLRLTLERPDSVQRRFWPNVSAVGHLASQSLAPVHRPPAPTGWPEIALTGDRLQLGGFEILDGDGDVLWITASTPKEFRGFWRHSAGLEIVVRADSAPEPQQDVTPQGYFCARRVTPW